jgi:hypothetical protein
MTGANGISAATSGSLVGRPAAYQLMSRVLEEHGRTPPRGRFHRFLGTDPLGPEARSWFEGAVGEQQVSRWLSQLGPDWTVFHSVPVGTAGSDIDHVVMGPPGVFAINTKNHARGKIWVSPTLIMVNGQKTDHLRNSRFEAGRATKVLSSAVAHQIRVRPIIALAGDPKLTVRQSPADVLVLRASGLVGALQSMSPVYTREQLAVIWAAASNPAIWSSVPLVPVDPSIVQGFADLQDEILSAKYQRLAMRIAGAAGLMVAAGWALVAILALLGTMLGSMSSALADIPPSPWTPVIILGVMLVALRALFPGKRR